MKNDPDICKTCGKPWDEHEPSDYLIKSIKQSEKDEKEGKVSPLFSNVEEGIAWLNDDHAKLMNGECSCGKKKCKIPETWNKKSNR